MHRVTAECGRCGYPAYQTSTSRTLYQCIRCATIDGLNPGDHSCWADWFNKGYEMATERILLYLKDSNCDFAIVRGIEEGRHENEKYRPKKEK